MKQTKVLQIQGLDHDRDELITAIDSFDLSFIEEKAKIKKKNILTIADELISNKRDYSPNSNRPFLLRVTEDTLQNLTVVWKDFVEADPKNLQAFKDIFNAAAELKAVGGKEAVRELMNKTINEEDGIEFTEKNQNNDDHAGVGFLKLAKISERMKLEVEEPEDGKAFVKYEMTFDL